MWRQTIGHFQLRRVIKRIEAANDFEIQEIMNAVRRRYAIRHPDWDVIYAAVHKDAKRRDAELEQIFSLLKKTDSLI